MNALTAPGEHAPAVEDRSGKYLTFFLGEEEYGIEILRVREIIGLMPITDVPRTADYVLGVVNLRGKVIPILELRARLGLPRVESTDQTCIVVVHTVEGDMVGLVVDAVSEVTDMTAEEIVDAPSMGGEVDTGFLRGIGKSDGRVRLLLDIDCVLDNTDLEAAEPEGSEA